MFFYDIPKFLAILILIVVSFRIGLIPLWLSFFLGIFALTPFFLNDLLFPASYMPDQFAYYDRVHEIRSKGLISAFFLILILLIIQSYWFQTGCWLFFLCLM